MSRIHTGDDCLRCETLGRVPNPGTIPVVMGPYEGFICTQCKEELEDENALYYSEYVEDED